MEVLGPFKKDHTGPTFEKFTKIKKMHLPEGAIRQKMTSEGLAEDRTDAFFRGGDLIDPTSHAAASATGQKGVVCVCYCGGTPDDGRPRRPREKNLNNSRNSLTSEQSQRQSTKRRKRRCWSACKETGSKTHLEQGFFTRTHPWFWARFFLEIRQLVLQALLYTN